IISSTSSSPVYSSISYLSDENDGHQHKQLTSKSTRGAGPKRVPSSGSSPTTRSMIFSLFFRNMYSSSVISSITYPRSKRSSRNYGKDHLIYFILMSTIL